ncbi:MAG: class I SAM-dependent methyltransferase [Phycisphaerae bacterium]
METVYANWYERPHLYDIAFGWNPSNEVDFVEEAFKRFADNPVERIYEPFCGTGRIAIALARRGYHVIGADMVPAAVAYARDRARAAGVEVELTVGDARVFRPAEPVDAIVALIDSFRLLATAEAAASAAREFAAALRSGGVLVIGIDIGLKRPLEAQEQRWTMERDGMTIGTLVSCPGIPGKTPGTAIVRSVLQVTEATGHAYKLVTDDEMRDYTPASFRALFESDGAFALQFVTTRKYDPDHPIELTRDYSGDIVAVFRKTK